MGIIRALLAFSMLVFANAVFAYQHLSEWPSDFSIFTSWSDPKLSKYTYQEE